MAILIVERRAGLAEFEDDIVNRADIREVMQRVTFEADPAADEGGFREMTSLIEIRLNDGRVLKTRADFGKGSPANPMSDDELIEKFLDCLAWAEDPGQRRTRSRRPGPRSQRRVEHPGCRSDAERTGCRGAPGIAGLKG